MNRLQRWFPSRRWLVVPPVLIGVAVLTALASSRKQLPRSEPQERAIAVQAVVVRQQPIRPSIVGYGVARPKRIWSAIPEVGGRVTEAHPRLRSGYEIARDEVLVRIDPADYELQIKQRLAELQQAEAQLEQIRQGAAADRDSLATQRALLDVRQREVDRLRQLRGNSAASQSESDAASAAYLQQSVAVQSLQRTLALSPAQINSAEAAIDLAEARLSEARRDLDRTTLTAPFDGLLVGVSLEPQQFVAPGERLFELHDTHSIEVVAQFSLSQLSRLVATDDEDDAAETSAIEQRIEPLEILQQLRSRVTVRSGDVAVEFDARPIRISGVIDQQTRTMGVIVEVTSAGKLNDRRSVALRSGAYCEVELSRGNETNRIVVPRTAVRDGSVFVIDASDRLVRTAVRVRASAGRDLVVDGLQPGQRLVVQPPPGATAGLLVHVPEESPAGDSP